VIQAVVQIQPGNVETRPAAVDVDADDESDPPRHTEGAADLDVDGIRLRGRQPNIGWPVEADRDVEPLAGDVEQIN